MVVRQSQLELGDVVLEPKPVYAVIREAAYVELEDIVHSSPLMANSKVGLRFVAILRVTKLTPTWK